MRADEALMGRGKNFIKSIPYIIAAAVAADYTMFLHNLQKLRPHHRQCYISTYGANAHVDFVTRKDDALRYIIF